MCPLLHEIMERLEQEVPALAPIYPIARYKYLLPALWDINRDGQVTTTDTRLALQLAVGKISAI